MNHLAKQIRVESGRLDQLIVGCAELFIRGFVEPRMGGLPLWDKGVGAVVECAVTEAGVPTIPVTPVDIGRMLGLLRPAPQLVADQQNNPGRRRRGSARVR